MRYLNHLMRLCTFMLLLIPSGSIGPIPATPIDTPALANKTVTTATNRSITKSPAITSPPNIAATPTVARATATIPTDTQTPIPTAYRVQSGDSLSKIAAEFGIPVAYLAYKNQIYDPDLIFEGQVLDVTKPDADVPIPDVNGKVILVKLSEQKVFVYDHSTLIKTFVVSTGLSNTPTVTGTYYVYAKHATTRMTGPGYDLPKVPWTMYFYKGYGLHGAYWHNNFGQPMSHGCVNMRVTDAEWLFYWAPMYTTVIVEN